MINLSELVDFSGGWLSSRNNNIALVLNPRQGSGDLFLHFIKEENRGFCSSGYSSVRLHSFLQLGRFFTAHCRCLQQDKIWKLKYGKTKRELKLKQIPHQRRGVKEIELNFRREASTDQRATCTMNVNNCFECLLGFLYISRLEFFHSHVKWCTEQEKFYKE